jgi:putative DNA primase/helicase
MGDLVDMPDRSWRLQLRCNGRSMVTAEVGNAYLLLTNAEWRGCLAYDEFSDRIFWAKQPPPMDGFVAPEAGADITDQDVVYVQHYISRLGVGAPPINVTFRPSTLNDAMAAAAHKNKIHPLRDYLNGLRWDAVQRLPKWCTDYLGCPDTPYASAVGTWWMVSAVARVLQPGCQVDHMLLLEGEQGIRKSTAIRVLAGDWYLPELPDVHSKDAAHSLHGRWIVECGELDALRRSEVTAVRDFLTRTVDIYRPAYGRNVVRRPRSVVFAGTTNDYQSLNDPAGARRYWPIRCGDVNIPHLKASRDQLFAEAVERFHSGEQWHPTPAMMAAVRGEQEDRYQEDSLEYKVNLWAKERGAGFTMADVLGNCLSMPPERWTRAFETRVGAILRRAGYETQRVRTVEGLRRREYVKITDI